VDSDDDVVVLDDDDDEEVVMDEDDDDDEVVRPGARDRTRATQQRNTPSNSVPSGASSQQAKGGSKGKRALPSAWGALR
jgi:hypothetical protein